jgi:TolB-like protein
MSSKAAAQPVIYEFGGFRLDPERQLLTARNGTPITLPPRAFDLLVHLVERHGQLAEKGALMKAIWPNVVVEDNNLSQHLSTLRQALGDGREGRRYIVTVPGRGYRFVADVQARRVGVSPQLAVEPRRGVEPAHRESAPPASVAVLPFANVSGEPEKEYFGDGMAEEILHLLSRVPGLKVPARTSSFAYKGKSVHVREVARDLGVTTVLEGSVRSSGDRIRVNAQLVDAETGYQIWSESLERKFEEVFALQDEIANAIVQSLRAHLKLPLEGVVNAAPLTKDVEAYRFYLQAVSLGSRATPQSVTRAIELLQRATARDPGFARAWALMAMLGMNLKLWGLPHELAQVQRDAEEALHLDPGLAEAQSALAMVQITRRQWLEADAHFRAAFVLARTDALGAPFAYHYSVYLTAALGYVRETVERLGELYRLSPASPLIVGVFGAAQLGLALDANAAGDAVRYIELAQDLGLTKDAGPLPAVRSYAAWRLGRHDEAADAGRDIAGRLSSDLREAGGTRAVELVFAAMADRQPRTAALTALDKFLANVRSEQISPDLAVHLIAWYTLLGGLDQAFEFANRILDYAIPDGAMGIFPNYLWMPELLPFRRDPRFQALASRLRMFEYWAVHGPPDGCELKDGRLIVL